MDYNARFYSPRLGRFIQPDSIVPGTGSQAFNRYTYTFNNPINGIDPSGHICLGPNGEGPCSDDGPYPEEEEKEPPPVFPQLEDDFGVPCTILNSYCDDAASNARAQGKTVHSIPNDIKSVGQSKSDAVAAAGIAADIMSHPLAGSVVNYGIMGAALRSIRYTTGADGMTTITGSHWVRETLGWNKKINSVKTGSMYAHTNPIKSGFKAGVNSWGTWLGIFGAIGVNTLDYYNGDVSGYDYAAGLTVDIGATILISGLTGALAGGIAGIVGGAGVLSVPLAIAGAIGGFVIGAWVGFKSIEWFHNSGTRNYLVGEVGDFYEYGFIRP